MNLKELLKDKLAEEELKLCPRSYEAIGDIAILEIPEELALKEKTIAKILLDNRKNIRLVVKKGSEREGEFRLKNYVKLAGEGSLETTHKENYCTFILDISKVYFSGRESTERERISSLVKDDEKILVMGAGSGPFPIVIAKNNNADIVGVDFNPDAIEYFKKNIEKNKTVGRVDAVLGDAKEYASHHKGEFNRVLVTMPQQYEGMLEVAAGCVKPNGTLHYYVTGKKETIDGFRNEIEKRLDEEGFNFDIKNTHVVLPYSPGTYKYCIEISFY